MFDYVKRADYDREREARIRAEAERDVLREQLATERAERQALAERLAEQSEQQQPSIPPGSGVPAFLTSDQLRHIPAAGKREIQMRNRAVIERKEEEKKQARDVSERNARLAPEERAAIEQMTTPA